MAWPVTSEVVSGARLRNPVRGQLNVKSFGAVGDGLTDDTAAIKAGITALGKGGGTLYFPEGTYIISSTLELGVAGAVYHEGVSLVGEASSVGTALGSTLRWVGAADGTMMRIRNSSGGEIVALGFNSYGGASYGVQLLAVSGDTGIVSNWRFHRCRFQSAKIANVLIGSPTNSNYGDCSNALFDTCFFAASQADCTTTSHVRQYAEDSFGTMFLNCRFSSNDTNYPQYGISLQAGTAVMVGGVFESISESCIYMDAAVGAPVPSICVYGVEAQSGKEFLRTAAAGVGADASQRATVISGVLCSDIIGAESAISIYWDQADEGSLVLQGFHPAGDIQIASTASRVFCNGVAWTAVAGGFTGVGAARVAGSWFKSEVGNQAIYFHHRFPDLITYADNAAAVAAGLTAGKFYKTAAGAVMVVL